MMGIRSLLSILLCFFIVLVIICFYCDISLEKGRVNVGGPYAYLEIRAILLLMA